MGSVVPLGVKSNPGYRVRSWRGADDESSTDPNNSVTMLSDKVVSVDLAKKLDRIKANVKAGKIVGRDTIKLSGNFYLPLDEIVSAKNIEIKIGSFDHNHTVYTESLDFDSYGIKKGRYAYKHKIPKGAPGAITSFNFNLIKNTFALEARKINLTGLQSPLFLDIEFGDHDYVVLAELDEETINGPRRFIPMRLMRSFADSLRVNKAIVRINKGIDNDSLTVRGALAAKDPSVNLEQKIVTIKWGDQTFLIPTHEFKKNKKVNKYRCKRVLLFGGEIVFAAFDLDKCIFNITIKKANLTSQYGQISFGVKFGDDVDDFNQTVQVIR